MAALDDLTAILIPMPDAVRPAGGGPADPDLTNELLADARSEAQSDRDALAERLQAGWDGNEDDPVLACIEEAAARRDAALADIRRLVAYAREFTRPRPYTLDSLAAAAGMSISGVRTVYTHGDVDLVADAIGRAGRDWRATDA